MCIEAVLVILKYLSILSFDLICSYIFLYSVLVTLLFFSQLVGLQWFRLIRKVLLYDMVTIYKQVQ